MATGAFGNVFRLAFALLLIPGCEREALYPIVGPDGTRMVHVACEDAGRCYQIAGGLCPYGYDLWLAVGDAARNVLVRCRAAQPPAVFAAAPPPPPPPAPPPPERTAGPASSAQPAVVRTPASGSAPAPGAEPWPPAGEPGTWPSASSSATWPPKPDQATNRDAAAPDVGY